MCTHVKIPVGVMRGDRLEGRISTYVRIHMQLYTYVINPHNSQHVIYRNISAASKCGQIGDIHTCV